MTEEERALLFREQRASRCRLRRERHKELAGDAEALAELRSGWEPLSLAQLEAGIHTDPDEEELLCSWP